MRGRIQGGVPCGHTAYHVSQPSVGTTVNSMGHWQYHYTSTLTAWVSHLQVFDAGEDPRVESRMLMFGLKSAADVAVGSGALNAGQRHRLTAAELTVGVYPVSGTKTGAFA